MYNKHIRNVDILSDKEYMHMILICTVGHVLKVKYRI